MIRITKNIWVFLNLYDGSFKRLQKPNEANGKMFTPNRSTATLAELLLDQGFHVVDEFDSFVTYQQTDDALKLHVGPDGSFTALDGNDEIIVEGQGAQDLYGILVSKTVVAVLPGRRRQKAARVPRRRILPLP